MATLVLDLKEVSVWLRTEELLQYCDDLCRTLGLKVLNRYFHEFDEYSITVLYSLVESHLSVHTFPEKNTICFDLYTCNADGENKVLLASKLIENKFGGKPVRKSIIKRTSL